MNRKDIQKAITGTDENTYIPTYTLCDLTDKPDLCRPWEQLTIIDVKARLEKMLKPLSLGEEEIEPYWVSRYSEDDDELFPKGEVICGINQGGCEGTMLNILVCDRKGVVKRLFSAKYFERPDIVGLIAAKVSEAFDRGFYYQQEMVVKAIHSSEKSPYELAA